MTDRVHFHPDLIFSPGTQVVTLIDIPGAAGLVLHPRGTVGVIVKAPTDHEHSYRVRFADGEYGRLRTKLEQAHEASEYQRVRCGHGSSRFISSILGQPVLVGATAQQLLDGTFMRSFQPPFLPGLLVG